MKKMIVVLALAAVSTFVMATEDSAPTTPNEMRYRYCEALSDNAYAMMYARQNGVSMSRVLEISGDSAASREMVINAYDEPRWASEELKIRAMEEFRDFYHLLCIRTMNFDE